MKAEDIQAITCLKATRAAQLFSWLEALPDASSWAFRGQPRCWGSLSPSFSREFPADAPRRIVADIERKIMQEFRARYPKVYVDASGLPQPQMVASGSELLCLSVMQHYGVRTRLLDWTMSFDVALYFACAGDPDSDGEVWAYDRADFSVAQSVRLRSAFPGPFVVEDVLFHQPVPGLLFECGEPISPRMQVQSAFHTVASEPLADHAELLHEVLMPVAADPAAAAARPQTFQRIEIAAALKNKVLQYLGQDERVTAERLFPDLEGLGRYLRWQMDSYRTMLF